MRILGPLWGFVGVSFLLLFAVWRLAPRAWEAMSSGLTALQWGILGTWTVFMAVGEGYRGFQKRFSPRTAARVRYLRDHPSTLRGFLAPLFCMGYFHATRKVRITSICLTLGIVILVVLVSFAPQPWRGIIDFGVVVGLVWGWISFLLYTLQALSKEAFAHAPETPTVS